MISRDNGAYAWLSLFLILWPLALLPIPRFTLIMGASVTAIAAWLFWIRPAQKKHGKTQIAFQALEARFCRDASDSCRWRGCPDVGDGKSSEDFLHRGPDNFCAEHRTYLLEKAREAALSAIREKIRDGNQLSMFCARWAERNMNPSFKASY